MELEGVGSCARAPVGRPENVEDRSMGLPERAGGRVESGQHERERRLAIMRPVVEFDVERLKRLQDRMRDTRDP
jgi:hypothetical protein